MSDSFSSKSSSPKSPGPKSHWGKQAKQWSSIGVPLRPCQQDVELFEDLVQSHVVKPESGKLNAIVLGVTSEIVHMQWPSNTRLAAIDRKMEMIDSAWKANSSKRNIAAKSTSIESIAINGDWFNLSLANEWANIIIGDGCFTFFSFPNDWKMIKSSLHNAMADQGVLILRLFAQADTVETPEQIFSDLHKGRIGNFHILKMRLAMSLQTSLEAGIKVGDVWQLLNEHFSDLEVLAALTGWPLNEIETINAYKDSETFYYFPTVKEIRSLMSESFEEICCLTADYEMADHFPIFAFRKC